MSHVLIVDDHEENLTLLDTILRSNGYAVMQANNGAEALQAARGKPPDLIISDIFMPVMDGFALCREWTRDERLRQIPFIFYTATYTDPRDEELGLSLGAVRFIVKPTEPEAFVAMVRQVLQEHETGRLAAPRQPAQEETVYYRLYNEALVRKLEDKMLALEQDITTRKRVEEALRESEERLRRLADNLPNGMVYQVVRELDGRMRFLYVSAGVERINGVPVEAVLHDHSVLYGQILEEDRPRMAAAEAESERRLEVFNVEVRARTSRGELRWLQLCSSPRWLPDGRLLWDGIEIDITERKQIETERLRLETQLRQQQKLEAIGTLASGVAHEINNPITGIMNYAQLIADKAEPGSQPAEYAGEILRETDRVATIVRNLLQFARQEEHAHSPARIADIVEQTLSLLRAMFRRDQITLTVDVPEDIPSVKCRSQQIQQVLMNLLTNARDALNERYPGHHEAKTLAVRVASFEQGGCPWLRLTVADQGLGIPPEIQARIFDPFFTTKPRDMGTGLGLSISHGIVKDHQGVLHFDTDPGTGTRFHLDLPVDNGWTVEEE